jgi:hypothetical protein
MMIQWTVTSRTLSFGIGVYSRRQDFFACGPARANLRSRIVAFIDKDKGVTWSEK